MSRGSSVWTRSVEQKKHNIVIGFWAALCAILYFSLALDTPLTTKRNSDTVLQNF